MFDTRSPHKGRTGIRRIWNALGYSIAGMRTAYKHESAFRQELWLAAALIITAVLLPVTMMQRALLMASVLLVLVVELLNSAIEAIADRVTKDHDELAKQAKDMGSAAVLVSLASCVIVWAFTLYSLL
jgi:diacylglycerol kinase (ATP)